VQSGINYAPPFITHTSGEASPAAATPGDETLILHGANLGESTLTLERVSWGADGGEFAGRDCFMVEAHSAIQCTTSEGAGRGLRIDVVVDGIRSAAPRTSFRAPEISGVSAPTRANGFSTRGGEQLVIDGRNFGNATHELYKGLTLDEVARQAILDIAQNSSSDPLGVGGNQVVTLDELSRRSMDVGGYGVAFTYLDSVTVGPYMMPASMCNITQEHAQIQCNTLQGVGAGHRAIVSVGGQDSQSGSSS